MPGPVPLGLTKKTRSWRGAQRMGRQDHGDFLGLGQGPQLRLCFDGLLRVGQIDLRRPRLSVGISGQSELVTTATQAKKRQKVVLPSCHQAEAWLTFRVALQGLRKSCIYNLPASTALRFNLHDQVPVVISSPTTLS